MEVAVAVAVSVVRREGPGRGTGVGSVGGGDVVRRAFFGSGAVLFGRPAEETTETFNDLDCLPVNFRRGTRLRPEEVAAAACGPLFENDLHARHATLVARREELRGRLEADPEYCEPMLAV